MRAEFSRIASLLGILAVAACGGRTVPLRVNLPPPRAPDAPLPPEANRNAPPPVTEQGDPDLERLVLWCSQPTGPACTAAQQELGLPPAPTPAVPAALLQGARDLEDDCSDPDLAPLMQRMTAAVGATGGGWADQGGQILVPDLISDLYSGSGCTNAARLGDPPLKIHVVDVDGEPHFLVRVWEIGEAP